MTFIGLVRCLWEYHPHGMPHYGDFTMLIIGHAIKGLHPHNHIASILEDQNNEINNKVIYFSKCMPSLFLLLLISACTDSHVLSSSVDPISCPMVKVSFLSTHIALSYCVISSSRFYRAQS